MLAKRIIPCLDVKEGKVVKGVRFENHQCVGEIEALAAYYNDSGADELVFYDITASTENCCVDTHWIQRVAKLISIPFCVAGGIKTPQQAEQILAAGADKISINSPALNNPNLITTLAEHFGQQCVVVGIDSFYENNDYLVYQYTGDINTCQRSVWRTEDWVKEVENRGAGEIVLNCMNQDGVQKGYNIDQYRKMAPLTRLPLIASGGAGQLKHFLDLFNNINVEGALAASVFHNGVFSISQVKQYCQQHGVEMRA